MSAKNEAHQLALQYLSPTERILLQFDFDSSSQNYGYFDLYIITDSKIIAVRSLKSFSLLDFLRALVRYLLLTFLCGSILVILDPRLGLGSFLITGFFALAFLFTILFDENRRSLAKSTVNTIRLRDVTGIRGEETSPDTRKLMHLFYTIDVFTGFDAPAIHLNFRKKQVYQNAIALLNQISHTNS